MAPERPPATSATVLFRPRRSGGAPAEGGGVGLVGPSRQPECYALCGLSLMFVRPLPRGPASARSDRELTDFIRTELEDYWLPVTAGAKSELWLQDVWVDLGMLTFARASVTLREGRLLTKREALAELRSRAAPAAVLDDIHRRRYGPDRGPRPVVPADWLARRAELAREFVRTGIIRLLAHHTDR